MNKKKERFRSLFPSIYEFFLIRALAGDCRGSPPLHTYYTTDKRVCQAFFTISQ